MNIKINRERFVERLVRVFRQSGYAPACLLTISPLELSRIKGITVPGIRAVLYLQHMIFDDPGGMDAAMQMLEHFGCEVTVDD